MVSQPWTRPVWHATVDSTNTRLLQDPQPGAVLVADHQTAGAGRRGRQWVAPPGTALAVSVVLTSPGPDRAGWVPLLAGLAVSRALEQHELSLRTVLKWPNDVMVPADGLIEASAHQPPHRRPGKVCGVLAQAAGSLIVVGAGLNIDQSPDELPVPGATSWRLALGAPGLLPRGVRQSWLEAYLRVLGELVGRLQDDRAGVASAYLERCDTVGREVRLNLPGGQSAVGTATKVDDDGALILQTRRGPQRHHAADVVHLRARPAADTVRS
jgi:BirA family biotin operon repressor/biotin-[acetyl-CoA-carboxylase] ligase